MAIRSHIIESRKTTSVAMVNQTGGPWTTITLDTDDVLPPSPGITRVGGVFTVSATGLYLIKYFIGFDETGNLTWPNYTISMGRLLKNGATVIIPSYANSGHYTNYGRQGIGHSVLIPLNAGDTIELQYRVSYQNTQYAAVPPPLIGGALTTTGNPAGPAVTTVSLEQVDEIDNPACISMHLTSSYALPAISTWYDFTSWVAGGVEDVRNWFSSPAGSTGEFTIPESGYYLVGYNVSPSFQTYAASLYNQRVYSRWLKNGTEIRQSNTTVCIHTTLGWNSSPHVFMEYFDAGDLVKMQNMTTDVGTVWNHIGGSTTLYGEFVSSVFFLKISDHAATAQAMTTTPGDQIEAATIGASSIPAGWSEGHSDTTVPPIQWYISNDYVDAPNTRCLRYARDSTNNFDNTLANNGNITTGTFSFPSAPTLGGKFKTFRFKGRMANNTEASTGYDSTTIEIWSTGLGLLYTIPNTVFTGGGTTFKDISHDFYVASMLGRSDLYLVIKFDTIDNIGNSGTGQHLSGLEFEGLKQAA